MFSKLFTVCCIQVWIFGLITIWQSLKRRKINIFKYNKEINLLQQNKKISSTILCETYEKIFRNNLKNIPDCGVTVFDASQNVLSMHALPSYP